MSDCIFCKIINKEIPSKFIFESENIIAFNDIHPQAPTHILILPKKHIETINDMEKEDINLIGELFYTAKQIAKEKGISSYRLAINVGEDAGQSVFHIHLHLLAGKKSDSFQINF